MERTEQSVQEYDYRRYDRIWKKVAPELNPYPEVRRAIETQSASKTAQIPKEEESAQMRCSSNEEMPMQTQQTELSAQEQRSLELTLPGAQDDPCCMGTNSLASTEVLQGFIREELGMVHTYKRLSCCLRNMEARRMFAQFAQDEGLHAKKLASAYFLMTGERYWPTVQGEMPSRGEYCKVLRERYHEEACTGFNYERAANEVLDPCLKEMLMQFSEDEYCHARRILDLLAKTISV